MIPEKMFKQILDATNEVALTCRIESYILMPVKADHLLSPRPERSYSTKRKFNDY